ncbi:hypothetical protein B0F90DRAFT_1095783 [Multifurca ochricompacta]|uniref:F-box domain-containing protein n=1 Tax=Multifurca ochricompacta TaxID=376703 RepID=A0AAD4M8C2_9AGAM|nr:hypothetical protein B0F90DRAFT_1095783 [Multifurca ochricompacta]
MDPPILKLSSEILIEILTYLPLRSIIACKLTCRKLCIVSHSSLIEYIIQAFLAGVHDPFLAGASIAERSKALQSFEDAWRDLNVRQRHAHIAGGTAWPWLNYMTCDDYLLAVRNNSDDPAQPPGYSYVDLRQSPPFTDLYWTKVNVVAWQSYYCVFAFAPDENDLAVVVTCARGEDILRAEIRCLSFISGDPHPLATDPNLIVDFPRPSSPHHIHVQITGDHIMISCNGSPADERQIDVLFLVSWKEGKVTLLHDNPLSAMTFAEGFSRISETLFAFVHLHENAIFLYEFLEEPGRLEFVRALGLPLICEGGRLNFAQCLTEQNPIFTRTYRPNSRARPRFPFRHNPTEAVACFILGVGLEEIPDASMAVAIVVHRYTLVALANAAANERLVPWESWAPSATRCLEVPYWRTCSGPVGQRWGILTQDEFILCDFNPHSVRYATAQLVREGTTELRHENGNQTRVVTASTLLTAGLCFRGEVTTFLPYVETRAVCTPRWESAVTDDERLLGVYFKEDDGDAHPKVHIDLYTMGL